MSAVCSLLQSRYYAATANAVWLLLRSGSQQRILRPTWYLDITNRSHLAHTVVVSKTGRARGRELSRFRIIEGIPSNRQEAAMEYQHRETLLVERSHIKLCQTVSATRDKRILEGGLVAAV